MNSIVVEYFANIGILYSKYSSIENVFLLLFFSGIAYTCYLNETINSLILFSYNCFLKPFDKANETDNQQTDLESFYKNQASIYDKTRKILLQGRELALQLAVTNVTTSNNFNQHTSKKLNWLDIGGGTGSNIEFMKKLLPLNKTNFNKVIMVDFSPSLCEIAAKKFQKEIKLGIVEIVCADASNFKIEKYGLTNGSVDLITFSYSLSMIPNYYSTIDNVIPFLNKENGTICSVDFGVQSKESSIGRINTLGGLVNRNSNWLIRTFWRIWFEFDKVYLDASRRNYLEYKFGTIKSINLSNKKLGSIPYYIWIGCDKFKNNNLIDKINAYVTESPYLVPSDIALSNNRLTVFSKGHEAVIDNTSKNLPYPSIYYQKEVWRVYYDELNPLFKQFKNQYIYSFTWEDPREDVKILNINSSDSLLAITSAGDNLLHYACLPNPPKKIHGVDLNPCQNHLLELKLSCFKSGLKFDKIWEIFGNGKLTDEDEFEEILIGQLSPYLSSQALQYWLDKGRRTFTPNGNGLYYDTGSTRWALKFAKWIFAKAGCSKSIKELCDCKDLKKQKEIWDKKIKPAIFNPIIGKLVIGNSVFLWKALGVPINQANMINGSILQYIIDTLDPIVTRSLISNDNYFYYLTLKACYSQQNCPDYLTKRGYDQLTKNRETTSPLNNFRLHTDTLNDVLKRLASNSLTIIIIMDHMDWFDPEGTDADEEISLLYKALDDGGRVMLRSASEKPWYIKKFDQSGFICEPAAIRYSGESIDRCNMYASTWICKKLTSQNINGRRISNLKI